MTEELSKINQSSKTRRSSKTNRLSKIVTRTGDGGETALGNGERVAKDSQRIEVIGTVDELNSFIGFFIESLADTSPLKPVYVRIQHDLFDMGGELSMPEHQIIQAEHWQSLEDHLATFNQNLQPLKDFILPGGSETLTRCHMVRTIARRAERNIVALAAHETVNSDALIYLNRLSDLAFVTARWLADVQGEPEVLWQPSPVIKPDN